MWIGTDDGLNRYDGHNFTIYRNKPEDSTTVSKNIITSLCQKMKIKLSGLLQEMADLQNTTISLPPAKSGNSDSTNTLQRIPTLSQTISSTPCYRTKIKTCGSRQVDSTCSGLTRNLKNLERTAPSYGRTFLSICFMLTGCVSGRVDMGVVYLK